MYYRKTGDCTILVASTNPVDGKSIDIDLYISVYLSSTIYAIYVLFYKGLYQFPIIYSMDVSVNSELRHMTKLLLPLVDQISTNSLQ